MFSFNSWYSMNRKINYNPILEVCLGSMAGKKIRPVRTTQLRSSREALLQVRFDWVLLYD